MPYATPNLSAMKLVFDDEFNGTALDATKWTPNWFGDTITQITRPINGAETGCYDPKCAVVSDGMLRLRLEKRPTVANNGRTYQYAGGMVSSAGKAQFRYGYYEALVNFPTFPDGAATWIANWPSWWTNGQAWPLDGELDIAEGLSGLPAYHTHWGSNDSNTQGAQVSGPWSGWHHYAMLREPGKATFYYDGIQVGTLPFHVTARHYLLLNHGVGQYGGPVVAPAEYQVKYVHVYSSEPDAVAIQPQPSYGGPGDDGKDTGMEARLAALEAAVTTLKADVVQLNVEASELNADIADLDTRLDKIAAGAAG